MRLKFGVMALLLVGVLVWVKGVSAVAISCHTCCGSCVSADVACTMEVCPQVAGDEDLTRECRAANGSCQWVVLPTATLTPTPTCVPAPGCFLATPPCRMPWRPEYCPLPTLTPTLTPTATPTPPCKWCGTSCVPSSFQQMCTMQAPEAGTSCRQDSDNNNRCTKFFTGTGNPPTAPEGCHYQSIACTTSMPPSCTYKLVCGGVTPTKSPGTCSSDSDCGWCGQNCMVNNPDRNCIMIAPPIGQSCGCQSGSCVATDVGCRVVDGVVKVTPEGGTGTCHDIQKAIDVAGVGNEVRLAPGRYNYAAVAAKSVNGNRVAFLIKDKDITLSVDGFNQSGRQKWVDFSPQVELYRTTTTDSYDAVFGVSNSKIKLGGFAVENERKAAIMMFGSSGEIFGNRIWDVRGFEKSVVLEGSKNVRIYDNVINPYKQAIYSVGTSNLALNNNYIYDCESGGIAVSVTDGSGFSVVGNKIEGCYGAVNVLGVSGVTLMSNLVVGNGDATGFAVYATKGDYLKVFENRFENNSYGAVSALDIPHIIVDFNLFLGTTPGAPAVGGFVGEALHVVDCDGLVKNNTFVKNTAVALFVGFNSPHGGAGSRWVDVKNNIFSNNKRAVDFSYGMSAADLERVSYNDFWCGVSDCLTMAGNLVGVRGNVSVNPVLGNGYCLLSGSPALGSGEGGANMGAKGQCGAPVCRECGPGKLAKNKGNSDCDGKIDNLDFATWYAEYVAFKSGEVRESWATDFTGGTGGACDGKVDMRDFATWYAGYIEYKNILVPPVSSP